MASANNIQALREAKGWSRPELGRRMKTSGQQVERLEKSQRRLTHDWIDRAAGALGVDPATIISKDLPATGRQPDLLPTRAADAGETVPLRTVDLDLAMGAGSNIDDYADESTIDFDANLLRTITRSPPERLFVARGVGDSMFPTLINEDMLVIDTLQRVLSLQDRLWAISLFGAGAVKRLRTVAKHRVEVISDNPAHDNQEVSTQDLAIMGRVIWVGRRV